MILPEYPITAFTIGRYKNLAGPLDGVYVWELLRFTDNVDSFLKIFSEQDKFMASLFFEQQLNPMLKAYTEAKNILAIHSANEEEIVLARSNLKNICENACVTTLINLIKHIESLDIKQKNTQDNFYYTCSKLYPLLNTTSMCYSNNIQHVI